MADSDRPTASTSDVETKTSELKLIEEAQTPEEKRNALATLTTSANLDYSLKKYEDAAEKYSHATELQASINGEMSPQNADLLYLYGRCLFKVAILKNDVLGGSGAVDKDAGKKGGKSGKKSALGQAEREKEKEKERRGGALFEDGMGDDDEEEEEEEEEGEGGEPEEEEDDLGVAYEVLDMARVLFEKQVEAGFESKDEAKQVKERLADVRDLQSEISLENERFDDAVVDSKAALGLRMELNGKESELIAEAHYKLALAYEFSFNTSVRDAQEQQDPAALLSGLVGGGAGDSSSAMAGAASVASKADPKKLWSAVEHMAQAIESCEARVEIETKKLEKLSADEKLKKEKDIAEVKDIVGDMIPRVSPRQI
jgi:HAT1-interacting factor 1